MGTRDSLVVQKLTWSGGGSVKVSQPIIRATGAAYSPVIDGVRTLIVEVPREWHFFRTLVSDG